MIDEKELLKVLNHEIPITMSLGINVEKVSESEVSLSAPLEANLNHKQTAFGGSLYSVAVLTGWSMVYMLLEKYNVDSHIVIQQSEIAYHLPVKQDIMASCEKPSEKVVKKFLNVFKRKEKSRLSLKVEIKTLEGIAVSFTGNYVIHS